MHQHRFTWFWFENEVVAMLYLSLAEGRPPQIFRAEVMYIDSRKVDDGAVIDSEICVVGAGAAGIALAIELANQPFRVVLIESGGFEYNEKNEELSQALNVGRDYRHLPWSRLRYFGGTTNHWGGHCAPMNALNFEKRSWIPNSGWPFSRKDIDPYYVRAHEVIGLGAYNYEPKATASALKLALLPFDSSRVETVMSRYNARRFGEHFHSRLSKVKNLTTYLWGNVTGINRHKTNGKVENVTVRTLSGREFSVRGRYFVLALGGIENARVLLLSRNVEAAGLGNINDLVGRFFMEHIWYPSGKFLVPGYHGLLNFYGEEYPFGDIAVRGHIALPDERLRELQIPGFRAEIDIKSPSISNTDTGKSANFLRKKVKNLEWPDDLGNHLINLFAGGDELFNHFIGSKQNLPAAYLLNNYVEQVPNPNSRVFLASSRDALGLNRIAVEWQLSEIDKIGIKKAQEEIATEVGRTGFGRMRLEMPDSEDILLEGANGGAHHMGTTRMHENPRRGVVDADGRIHGLENIYVAGSSVFPTGGYANPTLTIVALAIRLADHLKKEIK
jgi:choline dehydrogenase-like flavoprotein